MEIVKCVVDSESICANEELQIKRYIVFVQRLKYHTQIVYKMVHLNIWEHKAAVG